MAAAVAEICDLGWAFVNPFAVGREVLGDKLSKLPTYSTFIGAITLPTTFV